MKWRRRKRGDDDSSLAGQNNESSITDAESTALHVDAPDETPIEATIEPETNQGPLVVSPGDESAPDGSLAVRPVYEVTKSAREPRGSFVSGLVGSVVEAWDEVRINRTRVLLSLIGIGVAVCALATVVGAGSVFGQAQVEQFEKSSGRPATLSVYPPYSQGDFAEASGAKFVQHMESVIDRYQISHATPVLSASVTIHSPNGVQYAGVRGVSAAYGVMHRVDLEAGRWLSEADELRLAPTVIINDAYYEQLGRPDLRTNPTLALEGENATTAVIVGVLAAVPYDEGVNLTMLSDPLRSLVGDTTALGNGVYYELWVPEEQSDELTQLIDRDVSADFGAEWISSVNRQDYLAWGGPSPLEPLQWALGGIAGLILLLGALGLVNISLVTVKYRVREIGVRRAFGATANRVFFAVMMESVVASVAAGVIGVALAIAIVQNPAVQELIAPGVQDLPAFPLDAALVALGASAAVGALAGLMPALVAVKVKVIDAIRY